MAIPKVGIVVLTYNSRKYIRSCLSSLTKNDYPDLKILVVDNASTDGTVAYIKNNFPDIQIIQNKVNTGYAKGNNVGIYFLLKKGCDYILLLNDDTMVEKNLIEELLIPFSRSTRVGIVGPIITYFYKPSRIWFAGGIFNNFFCYTRHKFLNYDLKDAGIQDAETDFISGCCLMAKKEVFGKIGLLEEAYNNYFEDVDLCFTAKKAGFVSLLRSTPLVRHRVSASFGQEGTNQLTSQRAYYYARNPFIFMKKYSQKTPLLPNIFGQLFIRFPYYTIEMVKSMSWTSIFSYFRGLRDGFRILV